MNNIQAQVESEKIKKENMTNTELKKYYSQKSKSQKTVGWVLIGAGALISAISVATAYNDLDLNNPNSLDGNVVGFTIGGTFMVGSIPLFIASTKNKKRASLIVHQSQLNLIPGIRRNITIKSIGIGIPLGK